MEFGGALGPGLDLAVARLIAQIFGNAIAVGLGLAGANDDFALCAFGAGIVAIDDELADARIVRHRRLNGLLRGYGGGQEGSRADGDEQQGVHGFKSSWIAR